MLGGAANLLMSTGLPTLWIMIKWQCLTVRDGGLEHWCWLPYRNPVKWCLHLMFDEMRSVRPVSLSGAERLWWGTCGRSFRGPLRGILSGRGINHWWEGVGKVWILFQT